MSLYRKIGGDFGFFAAINNGRKVEIKDGVISFRVQADKIARFGGPGITWLIQSANAAPPEPVTDPS